MKPKKKCRDSELLDKFAMLEIKLCEAGLEWEKVCRGLEKLNEKLPKKAVLELQSSWAERHEKIEKRDLELQLKAHKMSGRKVLKLPRKASK